MNQRLVMLSLVVPDYDEAIAYYTQTLGFQLMEDSPRENGKRWVVIKPVGNGTASLLLAQAANDQQRNSIGNQAGGRVFLFLHTDDFWRDYHNYQSRGVKFLNEPREEEYGTVAVFVDQYGNKWDLIQPATIKSK